MPKHKSDDGNCWQAVCNPKYFLPMRLGFLLDVSRVRTCGSKHILNDLATKSATADRLAVQHTFISSWTMKAQEVAAMEAPTALPLGFGEEM